MTLVRTAAVLELLDQQPPCNLDAEKNVLGSVLVGPDVLDTVKQIVTPEAFHDHRNARLFEHMLALRNGGGGAIDITILKNRLVEVGELEACGGAAYLAELFEWRPTAAYADRYDRLPANAMR